MTKALPILTAPATAPKSPAIAYFQARVNEAKQRLRDGQFIDWDTAVADVCALYNARLPPVTRKAPEAEAPADKPAAPTQKDLLAEFGL